MSKYPDYLSIAIFQCLNCGERFEGDPKPLWGIDLIYAHSHTAKPITITDWELFAGHECNENEYGAMMMVGIRRVTNGNEPAIGGDRRQNE